MAWARPSDWGTHSERKERGRHRRGNERRATIMEQYEALIEALDEAMDELDDD